MPMQLMCSRGCGHAINVSDEVLEEAKTNGAPLNVSHDVCPNDPQAPQRKFTIRYEVIEIVADDNTCKECDGNLIGDDDADGGAIHWDEFDEDEDHEPVRGGLVEDKLASMGETVEAGSFKLALPALQESLNTQWSRIVGMADTIDDGTPPPTPSTTEEGN